MCKIRIEINADQYGDNGGTVSQRCLNISNVKVFDQSNQNVIEPMQIYVDTDSYATGTYASFLWRGWYELDSSYYNNKPQYKKGPYVIKYEEDLMFEEDV